MKDLAGAEQTAHLRLAHLLARAAIRAHSLVVEVMEEEEGDEEGDEVLEVEDGEDRAEMEEKREEEEVVEEVVEEREWVRSLVIGGRSEQVAVVVVEDMVELVVVGI